MSESSTDTPAEPPEGRGDGAGTSKIEPAWRKLLGLGPADNAPRPVSYNATDLAQLAHVFEESGRGWFWSVDADLKITYVSPAIADRLGLAHSNMIGQPFQSLFRTDHQDGAGRINRSLPFVLGKRGKFSDLAVRATNPIVPAGQERWWSVSGSPVEGRGDNFRGYWGSALDITESRRSEAESTRLTASDTLTGLASRHRISQHLEKTLTAYKVAKRSCALLMIDLDRFKHVNDTLGHQAGDELLKQASQRLTRVTKEDWEVGRLGGDEFQVIIPDMDDRGTLGETAKRIIAIISQPYTIDGVRCVIGASVGVAIAPYDGITSAELTRSADLALYAAKNDGRGRFRFYSSDLHDEAEDRRQLEDDLRDALAQGEIRLVYQPVIEARTNLIAGFEALLRWDHPERGPVSPAVFIPVAEDANLIAPLGEWALRQACNDAASWPGAARVAVNVSPIQFAHEALPAIVAGALASSGLNPDRLELEITESVFLGDGADTEATFSALKKLGVRLALDDFGTGYSSLGYLKSAPFDKIKIDQSFVRDATQTINRNAAIITAIVSLAEALGMETTAEGVETLDTLDLIRKLKVSHVQGYVYSRAMELAEIYERMDGDNLKIEPSGPEKTRSDRKTVLRTVGIIHEDHRYEVMMRNLSRTGALIEGLMDVPKGTKFVVDFGEGQLAVATVKRSRDDQQGLLFEVPLVSDGSDGLCTRHRISPYALAAAGMPLAALPPGKYPLIGHGSREGAARHFSLPTFAQSNKGKDAKRVA